jgi:hypothetical protein
MLSTVICFIAASEQAPNNRKFYSCRKLHVNPALPMAWEESQDDYKVVVAPVILKSSAIHWRPLALSLSKDAGLSRSRFDRLAMSGLG